MATGNPGPGPIVYVVSRWRTLTETFIRREVDAARAVGTDVVVLSLKRPAGTADDDPPVYWLHGPTLLVAFLRSLFAHPVRTVRALLTAVRWSPRRNLPAHGFGVLQGVAAAAGLPPATWAHAHFAWISATAADAFARLRGIPFSVMPHAFDIFDDACVDGLLVQKLRRAEFVVVESEWIRAEVGRRYGCEATTLRMGIPAARVRTGTVPRPPGTEPLVLSVGALNPKKGHDILVKALTTVPGPWRAAIIGEGPERAALEALIESLGLQERVTLTGALSEAEVFKWLDEASVFCLGSRVTPSGDRDGVPNVLIEAMARGVPVVTTSVAGIPDLIGTERGVLVDPEDPAALAAALGRLLTDDSLRVAVATAARDHVRDQYTAERNWERLAALMARAGVSRDGGPGPAGTFRGSSGPDRRSRV